MESEKARLGCCAGCTTQTNSGSLWEKARMKRSGVLTRKSGGHVGSLGMLQSGGGSTKSPVGGYR